MTKQLRFFPRLLLLVFLQLAFSSAAWAWGPVGHRTVADVAGQFLTSPTKQVLAKYLNNEELATVSTWADQIKDKPQTWGHTFTYHFESVADEQTYLQSIDGKSAAEQKKGGLVAALLEAKRIFRSPSAKLAEKNLALKFLVHFVGDIHQPMHSGRPEDRGGNLVLRKWHKQSTNLHAIWDVMIIEEAHAPKNRGKTKPKVDDKQYADYLVNKFKGQPLPGQANDINLWLNESMQLRESAYEFKDESEESYTELFADSVDERIYKGGVRLASILTSLTTSEVASQTELGFRKAIETVLGPLENIINLNPKKNSGRSDASSDEKPDFQSDDSDFDFSSPSDAHDII